MKDTYEKIDNFDEFANFDYLENIGHMPEHKALARLWTLETDRQHKERIDGLTREAA